jgi:hypothetical protein
LSIKAAEIFNLFNHPQYGMPVNHISASGFGAVHSTVKSPRLVQLALKLSFSAGDVQLQTLFVPGLVERNVAAFCAA